MLTQILHLQRFSNGPQSIRIIHSCLEEARVLGLQIYTQNWEVVSKLTRITGLPDGLKPVRYRSIIN